MNISDVNKISFTVSFATEAHSGQVRKFSGEPYINHPLAVAKLILHYFPNASLDIICAAICHDLIEDTKVTYDDISNLFGFRVADLVDELTKKHGNYKKDLKYLYYISSTAKLIKLCDRLDNVKDLKDAPEPFRSNYKRGTKELLRVLNDGLVLEGTICADIMSDIEEKLKW